MRDDVHLHVGPSSRTHLETTSAIVPLFPRLGNSGTIELQCLLSISGGKSAVIMPRCVAQRRHRLCLCVCVPGVAAR